MLAVKEGYVIIQSWRRKRGSDILFPMFSVRSSTGFLSSLPSTSSSPGAVGSDRGSVESNHVSPSLAGVLTLARNALCTCRPRAAVESLVAKGRARRADFHIQLDLGISIAAIEGALCRRWRVWSYEGGGPVWFAGSGGYKVFGVPENKAVCGRVFEAERAATPAK